MENSSPDMEQEAFSGEWICSVSCLCQYLYPGCEVLQERERRKGIQGISASHSHLSINNYLQSKKGNKTKCQALIADRRPSGMRELYSTAAQKGANIPESQEHTHTQINMFSKDHPEGISANAINFRADR